MNADLYYKRNDRKVDFLYPVGGNKNVLRRITGVKLRSFTGPGGRGITVRENNGQIRSVSLSKCVSHL